MFKEEKKAIVVSLMDKGEIGSRCFLSLSSFLPHRLPSPELLF